MIKLIAGWAVEFQWKAGVT